MPTSAAVIALVVEPMAKSVWSSTGSGFAEPPHAVTFGEHHLAVLHHRHGQAGVFQSLTAWAT